MQELKTYFQNRQNLTNLIVLIVLVLAVPLGIFLAKNSQVFFSRADRGAPVELGEGRCIIDKDNKKINCNEIPLKLISPLGPPVSASDSASPTPSASATASASPTASPSVSPSASASPSPAACNPKKFDANTWSKNPEACKNGKQRVIYKCENKTKTRKQKCDPTPPNSSPIPQSAYNGPHNIPGKTEAEDFDNGGEDVAYHDTKVKGKQSKPYRDAEHVDIARTNDPLDKKGYDVSSLAGEWLEYTAGVLQPGSYIIESRVQSNKGGVFHIEIDGIDKSGPLTIPGKNSGKDWSIVKTPPIDLTEGQLIIRVKMDSGTKAETVGSFNYFEFKSAPTANLLQKIQNALTSKVFAGDEETDETTKSEQKKCSKRLERKGLCPAPGIEQNCNDKKDNDGDSKIDKDDPECHSDGNAGNKKTYEKKWNELPKPQCSDGKDNDGDGKIDKDDPGCHTDQNPQNNSSYDAKLNDENSTSIITPPPIIPPNPNRRTLTYRIAESESELDSAQDRTYDTEPIITNFILSDESPGIKQIWVEFFANDNTPPQKEHITLTWVEPEPKISSLSCTVDIAKQNLKIEITGSDLGDGRGKISSDGDFSVDVLEWKRNSVTALVKKPSLPTDDTRTFKIKLIRADGVELDEVPCRVDTSLIALGAKIFCRDEGKFDLTNVKVTIKDSTDNKVDETVTIDKSGTIQGLKTKLQAGKRYLISINAPGSLRKNAFFTASAGTSSVIADDGSSFVLPIGDIAPPSSPDGVINSADRAVLTQQWIVSKTSTKNLTADFNRDQRVNSFDWACMRYDFGKSDDKKPDQISLTCAKPPVCSGSLATDDPDPSDPLQCPVYSCETNSPDTSPSPSPSP